MLSFPGITASAQPFLAALLRKKFPQRTIVVVTENLKAQENFQQDLETWLVWPPTFYPAWEVRPQEGKLPHAGALLDLRAKILAKLAERATEDRFPLTPQRIVHDVREAMPPDGIVTLDNGMYKIWFARNYRTSVANTLLLDNALATMGAGLPSAIAAALIHPDRKVLAVCGDGGFMMNSQEMETAVRLGVHIVVLILEDHAYGMIRWKQEVDRFPDFGLAFGNPDFVAYARAYGATGSRVGSAADFLPTLKAALDGTGVHLVVCPVDYSENMRVLVKERPD